MVGQAARALGPIAPGRPGTVSTRGEIWNARSEDAIAEGDEVYVVAMDGLTLQVTRNAPAARAPGQ
jgi:membrane-bound serine protease (ClpP class)